LLLILLIVGIFVGRSFYRSSRLAPFRQNMDKYLADHPQGGEAPGWKTGKILPIDEKAKDVDPIYFDLPDDVVAQTPDEVGLVVRIKWGTQVAVQFKGGGQRTQDFCLIGVYDMKGYGLDGMLRFEGPKPQVRGVPSDPDSRSIHTRVAEWMKALKPGIPLGDQRPDNRK
jgi:hypothetical protein